VMIGRSQGDAIIRAIREYPNLLNLLRIFTPA
jgi:hypothetical protein